MGDDKKSKSDRIVRKRRQIEDWLRKDASSEDIEIIAKLKDSKRKIKKESNKTKLINSEEN